MEHVWTTEALAKAVAVEEVCHVGLALCLMDMNVLHQVKAHVEKGVGWVSGRRSIANCFRAQMRGWARTSPSSAS